MKHQRFLSAIMSLLITSASLNCINANALSIGDVNSDNAINSSDASLILKLYADYSTGKNPDKTDEELSAADVNCDTVIDASDASLVLAYYAHISTGGTGTIQEFISQPLQLNTKTFILPCISIELPKTFKYIEYSNDLDGGTSYSFLNNDGSIVIIQESIAPAGFTDEEILQVLFDAIKGNSDYHNVQFVTVNNLKLIHIEYNLNNEPVKMYYFVCNGRTYVFGVSCNAFNESQITMTNDMLKSIVTDPLNINIPCSQTFEKLSPEEKQYLLNSIMSFSSAFINVTSININQCCETIIDNKKAYIYDISYISSYGDNSQDTFICYPETDEVSKSYSTYEETIKAYSVIEYNAELINKAIRDYYNQFE